MVDVAFVSRAVHFVPLPLFRRIAALPSDEPTDDIAYIGKEGINAIKSEYSVLYISFPSSA